MTVAGGFGLAAQGFEFVPGLDFLAVEGDGIVALIVVEQDQHGVAHRQDVRHLAFAPWSNHALVAFGKFLAGGRVLLVFVDEATAQASAHAGDFGGRERDALFLGHFDGDGAEVGQEFGATAGFEAAGAHAAEKFRHVARADLAQFNLRTGELLLHVALERLEVRLVFGLGAEQEDEARAVVVIFRRDDFDALQAEFRGAGAAFDHGFGLMRLPGLLEQEVARGGAAFDAPPAAVIGRGRRPGQADGHLAEIPSAGGVHDDVFADLNVGDGASVEVIDFSDFGESDTDNGWLHGFRMRRQAQQPHGLRGACRVRSPR